MNSSRTNIVAALDIGSTKISCLIARVPALDAKANIDPRQNLRVLGFGQTLSRGVKSGAIINIDEAECAIRLAVDAAERMAEIAITDVYVSVSGGRVQSSSFAADHHTQTGVVSPRDLDSVVTAALSQVNVGKRTILHVQPNNFVLDGTSDISSPLGMHGDVLHAEVGVTSVEPAYLRNVALAVERSHLRVAGFVIAPYAASKSCLMGDELQLGTTVVELGGAITSIGHFRNGQLLAAETIHIGGSHVTSDIAQGLSTTLAHAERMKTMWGNVLAEGHSAQDMLAVPLLGERGVDTVHKVPKSHLSNILRPRVEETLELVRDKIAASSAAVRATASRIVLTGGASQLTGLRELATAILGVPVRLGQPVGIGNLPDRASNAGFAAVSGTLVYAARPDRHFAIPEEAVAHFERARMGYARRVGQWLAEAF
ncbi:MAG: cell division protein FtsA [Alphaproteobacteria bacterium]|nr:cell division protein FtsA [Alphaproteobacteria bacterium]